MSRKKYKGFCYLCGEYDTHLTKDHIPPECFAPNPLPSFTQTSTSRFQYAYACRDCNEYYSKIEKTFKNVMLMGNPGNIQAADDAWAEFISENNKSLKKYGIQSKEFREILQNFPETDIYTPGGIYLGNWRIMQMSQDSQHREEFIKIAKGLHYVHTQEIIPNTYEIGVRVNEQVIFLKEFANAPYFRFDTDFFTYLGAASVENRKLGIWYMQFYNGYFAQVWFRPKE